MPLVSVVLPVFNAAPSLFACLESIRAQTLTDWELVVVDDGSTDDSPLILKRAAAQDSRILFFPIAHRGVAGAMNEALRHARGEFIARMDADDVMLPTRLEKQVDFLRRHPAIAFVGSQVRFGGDRREARGYALHVDWLNSILSSAEHAKAQFCEYPLAHPSLMGRKSAWSDAGSFRNGDFPEDYEWFLRAMSAGQSFAKVPEPLLVWNDPPDRLTRSDKRYAVEAFFAAKLPFLVQWLRANLALSRPIWLWGAGQVTRRRLRPLFDASLPLAAWIDVDPRKIGNSVQGLPVHAPAELPKATAPVRPFILAAVGNRGARKNTRTYLEARAYEEGRDFLAIA
jgi:glycosyltransferase involved in cell wall biosynthesis